MDLARAQKSFARRVNFGTRLSLELLAPGFLAYFRGLVLPPGPARDVGRSLAPAAGRGDCFNVVGIALLASIIIATYPRVLFLLIGSNRGIALIAALEIAVLLAAASGLLNFFGGGHS